MAKVAKDFRDALTWRLYRRGDEYDGDRAEELARLGLLEPGKAEQPRRTRKAAPKG